MPVALVWAWRLGGPAKEVRLLQVSQALLNRYNFYLFEDCINAIHAAISAGFVASHHGLISLHVRANLTEFRQRN